MLMAVKAADIHPQQLVPVVFSIFIKPEELRILTAMDHGILGQIKNFLTALDLGAGVFVTCLFPAGDVGTPVFVFDGFDIFGHDPIPPIFSRS
jgi:hypothetical protein